MKNTYGSKDKLLELLGELYTKDIVIHFNCDSCKDEQVTYEMAVTEGMMDDIDATGYFVLGYECTNCGGRIGILNYSHIFGVEVM